MASLDGSNDQCRHKNFRPLNCPKYFRWLLKFPAKSFPASQVSAIRAFGAVRQAVNTSFSPFCIFTNKFLRLICFSYIIKNPSICANRMNNYCKKFSATAKYSTFIKNVKSNGIIPRLRGKISKFKQ